MAKYDTSLKENQSTLFKPNTTISKPGTNSVRHDVTSMLSNDVSQRSQLPVTSTVDSYQNIVPDVRVEFWKHMQPIDKQLSQGLFDGNAFFCIRCVLNSFNLT